MSKQRNKTNKQTKKRKKERKTNKQTNYRNKNDTVFSLYSDRMVNEKLDLLIY